MDKKTATDFFGELYGGKHHIPSGGLHKFGHGWSVNHYGDLPTFDFDTLTRLVFLCHDWCVRGAIQQSGPGMVKICIWQRSHREGSMFERHPTIEDALKIWREGHVPREDPEWPWRIKDD
ncbi:MAG: hypothetical protein ACYTFW_00930 [Planctomycetota bacterium]|jgi:hypothetical protein